LKEECADILIHYMLMAESLNLDIENIIKAKNIKNGNKYPTNKPKGSCEKYDRL